MVRPEQFDNLRLVYHFTVPLSANPTIWSNTFKQFVGNLLTNCLSVFDHFVGLALKGLKFLNMRVLVCMITSGEFFATCKSQKSQNFRAIIRGIFRNLVEHVS